MMQDSTALLEDVVAVRAGNVAAGIAAVHDRVCYRLSYNEEQSLATVVKCAFISAMSHYVSIEESGGGQGIAVLVYVPNPRTAMPALVVELKRDKSQKSLIEEIQKTNRLEQLEVMGVPVLLVSITYNSKTQEHICAIDEWVRKRRGGFGNCAFLSHGFLREWVRQRSGLRRPHTDGIGVGSTCFTMILCCFNYNLLHSLTCLKGGAMTTGRASNGMADSSPSLRESVMLKKMVRGQEIIEALTPILDDPRAANEAFLQQLMKDNQDTEFGRAHGFRDIHSIEDFQRNIPLSTYDDYADAIWRMTELGEDNIICAYPINHYNKSSGTMGNPKRIPLSDKATLKTLDYLSSIYYGIERDLFGDDWISGKGFSIIETPANVATLPCGATYGSISAKATLSMTSILTELFVSPLEALVPASSTNTRYLHALYALRDPNVSFMSCTFFSFMLEQLRYIQRNWQMLVEDIEKGRVTEESGLTEEVRARLESELEPMPERAAELREIFEQGFATPFVPKVWPNCRFVVGIGTSGFKPYADKMRYLYTGPDIAFLKRGISASEAVYSVPIGADTEDSVLLADGVFLEFLPLDAGDDLSQISTIDGLEVGRDYEVIVTNLSGLYRYRIRDAVRVTGTYRGSYTVNFLYRIDQTISIMGEKTTEAALRSAVDRMSQQLSLDVVDFSVFGDLDAGPVRYVFFLEIASNPEGVSPKEIWSVLEEEVGRANPSMGEKIANGTCGHVRVQFLEQEAYILYQEVAIAKGGNPGQLKPVHIIANEVQRRFFYNSSEYMYEYVM